MRAGRAAAVGARRDMGGAEEDVRRALREEAEAWRGRRAGLLGYSEEELEEALRSLEEVEAELLADWEVLVPREEDVEGVQEEGLLCPICKTGLLAEDSACQVATSDDHRPPSLIYCPPCLTCPGAGAVPAARLRPAPGLPGGPGGPRRPAGGRRGGPRRFLHSHPHVLPRA